MGNLSEQYQSHVVFQTIENKLGEIHNALENDTYNEIQKESLQAYEQIFTLIKINLSSKSLPMVPNNILANLNASITNISLGYLLDFNNSYSQYQALMDWFKRILTIEKKSEVKESFNKLIENFEKRQERIENNFNQEIEDFKDSQQEEFSTWQKEKEDMQLDLENLKAENKLILSQIKEFEEIIKEKDEEINDLIKSFKNKNDVNQEAYETEFSDKVEEFNTRFNELIETNKNNAKNMLEHMQIRKNDVEKLWGIIGQSAISGNSQNYANKAKRLADIMMWVTLGLMVVVVSILSITTIIDLYLGTFNYMHFMYKIIGSSIFLVPALYCSNISKRQRDREFQLRDFEVKVAALEPFMESMTMSDEEEHTEKDKVKLELTKSFFDKEFSNTSNHNDSIILPKEMVKVIRDIAKNLKLSIGIGGNNE